MVMAILGNALRLRKMVSGLQTADLSEVHERSGPNSWRWSSAPGAVPDAKAAEALASWASAHDLAALEVVPEDLRTEDALDLARRIDPSTYRDDCLAFGGGALQIVGATEEVWERMQTEPRDDLSPIGIYHVATEAKRYCLTKADIAVSDRVHAIPRDVSKRRAYLDDRLLGLADIAFASSAVGYLTLAIGLLTTPFWAGIALAAWSLQPLVVLVRTPVKPPDLWSRSLLRWLLEPVDFVRTVTSRWKPDPLHDPVPDLDALRAAYDLEYAEGHGSFFEERRSDCPICGSKGLRARVHNIPDLFQGKPGHFDLDECTGCGHVFQNPMLSDVGFAYYYRDFYDGIGAEKMQSLFGAARDTNVGRARAIGEGVTPKRWLDVGTGFAQFPLVAKEILRDTSFEALDFSDNIAVAVRRGWIDAGYHGELVELAPSLSGRYDVVSMHHYLEHTRDPRSELAAARIVLAPGGIISIEQPNPDSRFGDLLGAYWLNWVQPQHVNMVRPANMVTWLEEAGFEDVRVDLGPWHQQVDVASAAWTLYNQISFDARDYPWRAVPSRSARRRARVLGLLMMPVVIAAFLLDQVVGLLKPKNRAPSYRVVARVPGA